MAWKKGSGAKVVKGAGPNSRNAMAGYTPPNPMMPKGPRKKRKTRGMV